MPEYRRWRIPGSKVFLTIVTYQRMPIFKDAQNAARLMDCFQHVLQNHSASLVAYVILPDHIHLILQTGAEISNYSVIVKEVKRRFTKSIESSVPVNRSRAMRKERGVWQRRFWEHTIRDEDELGSLIGYIHSNPVRHGYVILAKEWPYSSFQAYADDGYYEDSDWVGFVPDDSDELLKLVGE